MNTKISHQQKEYLIVCGDLPVVGVSPYFRHFCFCNKVTKHQLDLKVIDQSMLNLVSFLLTKIIHHETDY